MPEIEEYHVVSFVIHAPLSFSEELSHLIKNIDGGEVHAISPEGKIVFTVEGKHQKDIDQKIITLKDHSGVLSLSPVYHQFLSESENAS